VVDSDRQVVRVEIEEASPSALDVPKTIRRQRDKNRRLFLGFAAVAFALLALLVAIRPDDASTADGSRRIPPTTTPVGNTAPAVTATAIARSGDLFTSNIVLQVDDTTGASRLAEVVPDGLGFLGVGFGDRDGSPVILRSVDGRTWQEVEALVRGVTEVPRHDGFRNFSELIRIEAGLAVLLLETNYLFAEAGGAQQETTRIIRLTSERGALWSVDPRFPVIEVEGIPSIFGHDEQHFGYIDYDRGRNVELIELLETSLIDDGPLKDLCSAARTRSGSAPALRLYQCATGDEVVVDATNLVQPERVESIFSCATALIELRGAPQASVLVERDAEPVAIGRLGTPAGPPVLLPNGEVAALRAPLPRGAIDSRCEGLVDGPGNEPTIEHWVDGELAARFAIPDDAASADDLFSARVAGVSHADGLRLSLGGSLWDVSLANGSWTRVIDLEGRPDDGQVLSLEAEDGPALLLGEGRLLSLENGAAAWVVHPLSRQLSQPSIIYNRDNVIFVRDLDDAFVIRLSR
jgi:hypothetical protein